LKVAAHDHECCEEVDATRVAKEDDGKMSALEKSSLQKQVQLKTEEVEMLRTQLKDHDKSLDDEEYLFERSTPFKRLSFIAWLHGTYNQLIDSESKDPQLGDMESLENQLNKYLPAIGCGIVHNTEDHYLFTLNKIHENIKAWVTKICGNSEFSEDQMQSALIALARFSKDGANTAQCFRDHGFVAKFKSKRHYKLLYTLFIALALFDRVLSNFVFGLDRQSSRQLHAIQNSIMTQGGLY
jgi:hypothetical protein